MLPRLTWILPTAVVVWKLCYAQPAANSETTVIQWNSAVLEAIRGEHLGPPMVARALAIIHTCMFDAWSAYDDKARGTMLGERLRRAQNERTTKNKQAALSYAAYRASVDLFPRARVLFDGLMDDLGYDPSNNSRDVTTAAGIGNVACDAVLSFRHDDGANQLGDIRPATVAYGDYTGYVPVNSPTELPLRTETVIDPNRYQPLIYAPQIRALYPEFVGAQWFKVSPFAGPYDHELTQTAAIFPVKPFGSKEFLEEAEELIELSATITDREKMISEYWSDGPNSELPPGHWCLFGQLISERNHQTLDQDTKMFFALTNALFDAGVAAWTLKRTTDSVRPITAIQYLYHGKNIKGWVGPGKGVRNVDGAQWLPYQPAIMPTPPFPEYPSGHSAFSAAAAKILELWTGTQQFGTRIILQPASSRIEIGVTPHSPIELSWKTFTQAADEAGMSRRYGGIHFKTGDLAGRYLGSVVAEKVWRKSKYYFAE